MFGSYLEGIEKVKEAFRSVDQNQRNLALKDLVREKQISFVDISKLYVSVLEDENLEFRAEISKLSLWLGMFLDGRSEKHKFMRKHLWEKGYFKDSAYGNQLDKEFADSK